MMQQLLDRSLIFQSAKRDVQACTHVCESVSRAGEWRDNRVLHCAVRWEDESEGFPEGQSITAIPRSISCQTCGSRMFKGISMHVLIHAGLPHDRRRPRPPLRHAGQRCPQPQFPLLGRELYEFGGCPGDESGYAVSAQGSV